MKPCLIIGSLLLAGSALTAVVPVMPKTLLPPPVERPGNHQLDGSSVHRTLTVGSQGGGAVAARVVEITDDVTNDWTNQVERKRRKRDAAGGRREYETIDRYDGPVRDQYQEYQDAPQNEYFPEDIEEVRYTEPKRSVGQEDQQPAAATQEYNPYQLFPPSFHELLDIPIHVYKNGTEVRTHERPPTQSRQPTVSGGYANTNLQGYGSSGSVRPSPRPAPSTRRTTTTRRPTTRRVDTPPPRRTQPPSITEKVHFVTTTPRAKIVTPGSGEFGARAPDDRRRPVTVKPSHELPDRVSAVSFGFGATNGDETESRPEVPRVSLHEKLAFGRRPEKTRKRVPHVPRPSFEKEKQPVVDWSRNEEEKREEVRKEDSEIAAGILSEYFAANTDFGAGFGNFGQKKDAAADFTTTTTTTTSTTTTTITTTRRPVNQEEEVYHVTPSAVEPPSWQLQWTTPRPVEEHKKSHKKPIFKKPTFQEANLPQESVGAEEPLDIPSQPEHRVPSEIQHPTFQEREDERKQINQEQGDSGHLSFEQAHRQQQENHHQQQQEHHQQQQEQERQHQQQGQFQQQEPTPGPFSQPIDPFAPIKDPFSQGQGPSFSSHQEPQFNPHQQQFQEQQFQPATPDREASISITSGPNLSAGPGSGIQQLSGPTFGGQPVPGPAPRPSRPFGRPQNRPPRPGRPQRVPVGDRRPVQQQNRPTPPTAGRPVSGFAGRPPVPLNGRPARPAPQGDGRPALRPQRPPPSKRPSGGGYLDSFLSWFRGGEEGDGAETRPLPPNTRPGPAGVRPRPQDGRPQPPPHRPSGSQRPNTPPQGFPPGFGEGPSAPFTPPPPRRGPNGNPSLERAPGSFVQRDPPPTSSGSGFGTNARPGDSFGVLPQFRPGVAGVPRLAHRRRGVVQRRRGSAASARQPNQQTVKTKTSKPSSSPAVSERSPESDTEYLVATPPPNRHHSGQSTRKRPSASLVPPRRRAEGRPASEDPRPPVVGRPTARPATLLNDKRIVVVGPFGAPPPGAPYIQHPEQLVSAGEAIARNASPARRVQDSKVSRKPATKSAQATRRLAAGGAPTSVGVGTKLSFSAGTPGAAAVKTAPSPAVTGAKVAVVKAPSQRPLNEGSPRVTEVADEQTGEFQEPEFYGGFRPILN